MDIGTLLPLVVSVLSTIAAILAWVAKLRWSDEFIQAKAAIIEAKEAQIKSLENEVRFLREISSPKLHEYFTSVKSQLEQYLDAKDVQLSQTKTELQIKETEIAKLQELWGQQNSNIEWELNSGINVTLEGMVRIIEQRDQETAGHGQRVTEMTVKLAKSMGVPESEIVHIKRGALLHDVGKINVPESILNKSAQLTPEEFEIMQSHTTYAYAFLNNIEYLRPALDIPYCHHEKWDGTGYPRKLKGTDIPLAARIFSVVDVWDALRTDRPYRPGWFTENIIEFLQQQSGKYFDPNVVDAFVKILLTENHVD